MENNNQIFTPINTDNLANNAFKVIPEVIKETNNNEIFESYIDALKNAETYEEKELISNTMIQLQKEANTHQRLIISSFSTPLCVGVGIGIVVLVGIAICDNKK